MNLTIEISWWVIPALVTLMAFAWAYKQVGLPKSEGHAAALEMVVCLLFYGMAAIASLASWLAWAVLT
ncbi:hypothetical protein [Marinobacter salarius]|uniref:Uncharacterized protein n=1 Tax=Marinobacter salarius TaxID=1420917 RepID=A0A1W6K9I4_9GAMM|nr:hypothetical protein [Marinobacter salarius]ARM83969.1 hypothetical protein MARSALSMR5_01891 [Marinobacter salarius]